MTPAAIQYRCRHWGLACGLQLSPHRLRHTFATRLINHGVSLESIRRLLGHRTLYMTQRYACLHDSTIRKHFEEATAHIEGILIYDWPHHDNPYVDSNSVSSVNSM